MQAVRVLGRVDQVEHRQLIEPGRQRKLHDVPGAGRVLVQLGDGLLDLRLRAVAGRSRRIEAMPTWAQSRCLPAT